MKRLIVRTRALITVYAAGLMALAALFAGGPPASAAAGSSQLNPGETLTSGQQLVSPSGGYVAVMQSDGNFVEYGPGGAVVWATVRWRSRTLSGPLGVPYGDSRLGQAAS
jgi:hypothetical protein